MYNKKKILSPKLYLKQGDTVQVITGKGKGSTGEILRIDSKKMRVIVEGVNMVKKHVKPTQNNPQGGIISKEAAVHYSNVLLYCDKSGRGERIKIVNENGEKKRVFVKSKTVAN